MGISDQSTTAQDHLATMPSSTTTTTTISPSLISTRLGASNMDGQGILTHQPKSTFRPWQSCIPIENLSKENLPPFYVRLQDDQVGHLAHWVSTSRSSITRLKLGQYWPCDFDMQGRISSRRDNWGAEYSGCGDEKGKGLGGGKKVPTWTDPGLPLTYTSSHKIMIGELDALKRGAALKRKAEEEVGRNVCMPVKKPRVGSVGVELKRMREEKKRQNDKSVEMEKERYSGAKPELRDALQVVDTLMRSATEIERQNAVLEAMLLKNETRYVKNTDDMFDEWLAYNEVKRFEVERIHEDHAVEIKSRDVKIETLEIKAKGYKARLRKEKEKVKVRDERLKQVKSLWSQEQNRIEKKIRKIENAAIDLDELSELNYETEESEDAESDLDAEPERVMMETEEKQKQESEKVAETKEKQKQKQESEKVAETEAETEAKATGPTVNETNRSLVERESVKSADPKEIVNLSDEDDDEEPISSKRKVNLRSSIRAKAAQNV